MVVHVAVFGDVVVDEDFAAADEVVDEAVVYLVLEI